MYVPCGKCGNCLKRAISDVTIRCKVEMRSSLRAYFVTLTYEKDPMQIYKSDLQYFFKRLRKVGFKFSYFALGDYGDTFGRPHYHVLFFVKGFFQTEYLHSLWISGTSKVRRRGFIHCRPLTMGRISYTVRYGFLAKLDWDKSDRRQAPFFLSSRRPALGFAFLNSREITRKIVSKSRFRYFADGKYKKPLPRYYHVKLFGSGNAVTSQLKAQERAAAMDQTWFDKVARLRSELKSKGQNYDAESLLVERTINSSDLFLERLRNDKRLKNKNL